MTYHPAALALAADDYLSTLDPDDRGWLMMDIRCGRQETIISDMVRGGREEKNARALVEELTRRA